MRLLPSKLVSKPACLTLLALGVASIGNANAGVTIKGPGDSSFSIGAGIRMSYTDNDAPNPDAEDADFNVDSTRIFTSGQITKEISAVLNFEKEGGPDDDDALAIMDAIGRFSFSPALNIWVGRQLPAVDRANLAGPYYATGWYYPGLVSTNPAIAVGRDDGVQIWGNIDKFKYVVGTFEGHNNFEGPGGTDDFAFTGRFTYSFIGSEAGPVYYENATYHGAADLLTLAFGIMYQADGVGTAVEQDDYLSWNIDVLYESKLTATAGSLTIEGAYYKYDYDVADAAPGGYRDNDGGLPLPGDAYLVGVAYLLPQVIGLGRFQPYVRYQYREYDLIPTGEDDQTRWEYGINYVMKGHDARFSFTYVSQDGVDTDDDLWVLGVQLQY